MHSGAVEYERTGSGIAYGSIGEGDPLLMVMGLGGTMGSWPSEMIDDLAGHHRVIMYDHRGVGQSLDTGTFAFEDLVDDLLGLMDHLGIERSDMLGFSMGAMIIVGLLTDHPERCRGAILLAGEPGGEATILPTDEVMESMTHPADSPEEAGMKLIGNMFPHEWLERHPDPREYFPVEGGMASQDIMMRQSIAIAEWGGCNGGLAGLECPVAIMHGFEDLISPVENSVALLERIPGSVLMRFEHAGHGMMYQCPREVAGIVDDFLCETQSS